MLSHVVGDSRRWLYRGSNHIVVLKREVLAVAGGGPGTTVTAPGSGSRQSQKCVRPQLALGSNSSRTA